jgi:hypothetical protein
VALLATVASAQQYGGGYGYGGYGSYGSASAAEPTQRRRLAALPAPDASASMWAMSTSGRALQQLLQAPTGSSLEVRRRGRSLMAEEGGAGSYGGGYGGYGGGGYGAYGRAQQADGATLDAFAGAGRRRALRRRG